MGLKELETYLWGAATYLRGVIDAGDYKQYIFPLLFYKRICDVYDEEYRIALSESDGDLDYASFAENHRFQIPEGAHWKDVRAVTNNVGKALSKAFREIERVNAAQLQSIFGDAEWTNKERLTDAMLCNLIEHFSGKDLSIDSVPNDMLGQAYEYLIRKFADDSGHTAAEFYTNRTVVRLMSLIADPQEGESVYDPTCGSGGLLLNCAMMLKDEGKEHRTLRLYGQEINLITSAIARMNMLLHGFEEFSVERGDTLKDPRFMAFDKLQQFDIVLANPPYSIKSWDQKGFTNDPYGRNIWGTPSQGCADYAFQQHIMKSMDEKNGRCVVLWPHGILFRDAERAMRKVMIESDCVDTVIGLGANLFYNSPMEACLLICRMNKPQERKGKIFFINAVDEVKQEKTTSRLEEKHIQKIFKAYKVYEDIPGFTRVVNNDEILQNNATLSIPLYVIENIEFSNIPTKLHTLVDINKETIKSNTSPDYQLKYLDIASIIEPKKIGELKEYSFKEAPSRARRIAKKGDLIISLVRPYLKSFVKIDNDITNLIASTGTAVLRAKKDISIDYIFHQFFSKKFTEFCESRMNGTNYPAITPSDLGDFDILLPDLDQQELIAYQLNNIDRVCNLIDNQIHLTQQLKLSLINQIF